MSLSLTGKRWIDPAHLSNGLSPVETLMRRRDLSLSPPLNTQPVFHCLSQTITRIRQAIDHHERIGVFGDYDCDGITASALWIRFFERRGIHPIVRLPSRQEGYGCQKAHIDFFRLQKVSLLLTVDTGITAHEAVEYANINRIHVIIVDHHLPPDSLPPAFTVIHPRLANPPLLPSPSAAGLSYILIRALEEEQWADHESDIALAGLGTIADLVDLKGLNRTIAHQGVMAWNTLTRGPLHALKQSADLDNDMTSTDIAFRLAPRINAAGRLDDPRIALTALLHGGPAVHTLAQLNTKRQEMVKEIYQPLTHIDPSPWICMADQQYHPGIIGLLAGKLTECFHRPSLVAHIRDDLCIASLRSIPPINIMHALRSVSDILISFGGHAQAAGCTFEYKNFPLLTEKLSRIVSSILHPSLLVPAITIDAELHPHDITLKYCEDVRRLEPFGQGNPEPRFLLRNVSPLCTRRVGSAGQHLQMHIQNIKTIGFGLGTFMAQTSHPLDVVCRLGINQWNGKREPQLFMDDLRLSIKKTSSRPAQACLR